MTTPSEEYRLIPLTRGQFAKVDMHDYDSMMAHKWCAEWSKFTRTFYACRSTKGANGENVRMHRAILALEYGDKRTGDHINRDTLDNRRSNLRIATRKENTRNSSTRTNASGFKGVRFHFGSYHARIWVDRKCVHLGTKPTAQEAYALYCEAAKRLHGEFAGL